MKILICENEDILLTALKFRLTKKNHELILAKDGDEAAQALMSESPDLVITELNLPKKSGLELLLGSSAKLKLVCVGLVAPIY